MKLATYLTRLLWLSNAGATLLGAAEPSPLPVAAARPLVATHAAKPGLPVITPVAEIPASVNPLDPVSLEQRWRDFGERMSSGANSVVIAKGRLSEQRGLLADALAQYSQAPAFATPAEPQEYAAAMFAKSRIIAIYASGNLTRAQLEQVRVRLPETPLLVPSPVSRTQLGDLYWEGKLVDRDEARAVDWYLRAAQSGGAVAMSRLAELWRQGTVTQKPDRAEAVRWFRRAALLGHGLSQMELGRAYLMGDGVDKNPRLAAKWLQRAAAQQQAEALALLAQAAAQLTPEERSRLRSQQASSTP